MWTNLGKFGQIWAKKVNKYITQKALAQIERMTPPWIGLNKVDILSWAGSPPATSALRPI